MKKLILPAVLPLLLIGAGYGQSVKESIKLRGAVTSTVFQYNKKEYRYAFGTDEVRNIPSWKPSHGEPPLSPAAAAAIAAEKLKAFVDHLGEWQATRISLEHLDADKWYYTVNFSCLGCEISQPGGGFPIIVMLNGKVIEPKVKLLEESRTAPGSTKTTRQKP